MEPLDIKLLGREYRVACKPEEKEGLLAAVTYLDEKMRDLAGKTNSAGERLAVIVRMRIQLGAIAGRQQHRLVHLRQRAQRRQCRCQRFRGERYLLAQADRRGLVVDAEDVQGHAENPFRCLR